MNIIEAIHDPKIFRPFFKDLESWEYWIVFLKVLFSLPLDQHDITIAKQCTGRTEFNPQAFREAYLICGRRSGKSFIVALIAVYLACFRSYKEHLSSGEIGFVMVLAVDRRQARVIMRYVTAFLKETPLLSDMVLKVGTETIELNNSINIEIQTASSRSSRGYTAVASLCDELAFWRSDESANPDFEILNAIRPAMVTIPNAMLLGLSSPHAKRGVLYSEHKNHYGKNDSNVLVWQAPTWEMNKTISKDSDFIRSAYERDPVSANSEFGAEFRTDLSNFISMEAIEAVTVKNVSVMPYNSNFTYTAFTDSSGGARDDWTLAICHQENDLIILDCLVGYKPPFSPSNVVEDLSKVLAEYKIKYVFGDRYAGEFPRELFAQHGINYLVSEFNRSQLYLETLPLIMSGKVQLLDNAKLKNQFVNLERRTSSSGRDSVDHRPNSSDDYSNSASGALVHVAMNLCQNFYFEKSVLSKEKNLIASWDKLPTFDRDIDLEHLMPSKRAAFCNSGWEFFISLVVSVDKPSVAFLVAKSPGCEVEGNFFSRDSVVLVDEVSTNLRGKLDKNLNLTIPEIANAVKILCDEWGIKPAVVASGNLFKSEAIRREFRSNGIRTYSHREDNSVTSLEVLRSYLKDADNLEKINLYATNNCEYFWDVIPKLPEDLRELENSPLSNAAYAAAQACNYTKPVLKEVRLLGF